METAELDGLSALVYIRRRCSTDSGLCARLCVSCVQVLWFPPPPPLPTGPGCIPASRLFIKNNHCGVVLPNARLCIFSVLNHLITAKVYHVTFAEGW